MTERVFTSLEGTVNYLSDEIEKQGNGFTFRLGMETITMSTDGNRNLRIHRVHNSGENSSEKEPKSFTSSRYINPTLEIGRDLGLVIIRGNFGYLEMRRDSSCNFKPANI